MSLATSTDARLLLVDDQEPNLLVLQGILELDGYQQVTCTTDPREAVRLYAELQPDLLVLDLMMPALDGFEVMALLEPLRPANEFVPILVLTADPSPDTRARALAAGATDFLTKPFDQVEVRLRIRNLLQTRLLYSQLQSRAGLLADRVRQRTAQAAQAEARYRTLVEQSPAVTYLALPDMPPALAYQSPQAQALLGYPPDEYERDPLLRYRSIHPDDRPLVENAYRDCLAEHAPLDLEYRLLHRDGRVIWVHDRASLLRDSGGESLILGTLTDITATHEAHLRVERQLQQLGALRAIDMAITASMDARVTLRVVLHETMEQLGVDAAAVYQTVPPGHRLRLSEAAGFAAQPSAVGTTVVGQGPIGLAAAGRESLWSADLGDCPELAGEGFAALWAAPLVSRGRVSGVLVALNRAAQPPDPERLAFLEALAGQAAIAIDSAALFDELQRSNVELTLAYETTLDGWSNALDLRDKETEGHTVRVTESTLRFARLMGFTESELVHIRRGALLHDIGKMGVPDAVLLKPGKLTDEEWVVMRKHPVYAYELMAPIDFLRPAIDIPYCHHEKWDGSGYPRGLKGTQVPLSARLFAIIDVWDALTSDRPYRPAWPAARVVSHLREGHGRHFDPQVLTIFLDNLEEITGTPTGVVAPMRPESN